MSENVMPLKGVKVIDFSIYVAAPAATTILGYLGAEVIKVETPKGDPYRGMAASYSIPSNDDANLLYDTINGYKKGICLDMRTEGGKAAMYRLIAQADIFITNYREVALKGMGLTYEEVRELNPKIVYGMGYGYGPKGPDSQRPGYDAITFFARSGFAQEASYAGEAPSPNPSSAGDVVTSLSLGIGILSAYLQAQKTGIGCKVSTSLYASALWALSAPAATRQFSPRPKSGGGHNKPAGMALFCDFRLKDEEWVRFCGTTAERYWPNFCRALGLEEYTEDPRFCTTVEQAKHGPECYALMAEKLRQKTYAEWDPIFRENDLPFEKVMGVVEALTHPQALANGYAWELEYEGKEVFLPMPPIKISTHTPEERTIAPRVGEHTVEVLESYGFSASEIEELIRTGAAKTR